MIYYLFAALIGAGYWLCSFWLFPDEPVTIKVLYRFLDPEYFAYIVNLSRFHFADFINVDHSNSWGVLFPFAGMLPYIIPCSVFGLYGFIIGDIFVSVIRFYLWDRILCLLKIRNSKAWSLVILLSTSHLLIYSFGLRFGLNLSGTWTDRIPRDYVTSLFILAMIHNILIERILLRKRFGVVLYLTPALLLLHSDVHSFIVVLPVMIYRLFRFYKDRYHRYIKPLFYGLLSTCLAIAAFLLIQLYVSPDLKERWGQFPAEGNLILFATPERYKVVISIFFFGLLLLLSARKKRGTHARMLRISFLFFFMSVGSFFASPIFSYLYRKNIQDYQFPIRTNAFIVVFLIFTIIYLMRLIPDRVRSLRYLGSFAALLSSIFFFYFAIPRWSAQAQLGHQPLWSSGFVGMQPSLKYRQDLSNLNEFLKTQSTEGSTLLTFDYELAIYWLIGGQRYLYLGDAIWSNQSTASLHSRFFSAARLLGLSKDQVWSLIGQLYYQARFLTGGLLQGNRFYHKMPLGEYSREELQRILSGVDNWFLVFPKSYLMRRLDEFEKTSWPQTLPKYIVFNNQSEIPDREVVGYEICLRLETFTVRCLR